VSHSAIFFLTMALMADHGVWRDRKGVISQNVLVVVNSSMMFTHILAGYEGSAHDGRVLGDCIKRPSDEALRNYPGKFYLADAGYALAEWCLTPYRNVRYHIQEWGRVSERPSNKKELYNFRHSSCRIVVECSIGILKNRFPVLRNGLSGFGLSTQIALVYALAVLHNIIAVYGGRDDFFWSEAMHDVEGLVHRTIDTDPVVSDQVITAGESAEGRRRAERLRESIADAMWSDYVEQQLL
jgi:hypothetical protein